MYSPNERKSLQVFIQYSRCLAGHCLFSVNVNGHILHLWLWLRLLQHLDAQHTLVHPARRQHARVNAASVSMRLADGTADARADMLIS